MSEFIIRANAVCVSGHRDIKNDINVKKVKIIFENLINNGIDTFLIGMAIGFDTLCFQILEEFKKTKSIKIIACIPCLNQADKFSFEQKKEYYRLLSVADEKIVLSENYTPSCMQKRNKFMVDNSSAVICYLNRNKGGTFNTVKYAEKIGIPVINVIWKKLTKKLIRKTYQLFIFY